MTNDRRPASGDERLEHFRTGSARAFEAVYRDYLATVSRIIAATLRRQGALDRAADPPARNIARTPSTTEPGTRHKWTTAGELPDLVQEVFLRAFSPATRQRFDGERDLGHYLGGIATHVVMEFCRAKRRQIPADAGWIEERLSLQGPATGDRAGDLAAHETIAAVTTYLAGLGSELRSVHELLYTRGLSQRAAAAEMGVGRQTIRTLESQLRSGLRRVLQRSDQLPYPSPLPTGDRRRGW